MIDPFTWARAHRPISEIQLGNSARSFSLNLRALDLIGSYWAEDLAARNWADYESGVDFPPVGGEPIQLSRSLCETCAALEAMQPDLNIAMKFDQLVGLAATAPDLFEELVGKARRINEEYQEGKSDRGAEIP